MNIIWGEYRGRIYIRGCHFRGCNNGLNKLSNHIKRVADLRGSVIRNLGILFDLKLVLTADSSKQAWMRRKFESLYERTFRVDEILIKLIVDFITSGSGIKTEMIVENTRKRHSNKVLKSWVVLNTRDDWIELFEGRFDLSLFCRCHSLFISRTKTCDRAILVILKTIRPMSYCFNITCNEIWVPINLIQVPYAILKVSVFRLLYFFNIRAMPWQPDR